MEHSPTSVIRKELSSKRILAIAIIYSATFFCSFVNALSIKSFFERLAWITEWFPSLTKAYGYLLEASHVFFIISLVGLIPSALMVVACWLIYAGSKKKKGTMVSRGLTAVNIFYYCKLAFLFIGALAAIALFCYCVYLGVPAVFSITFLVLYAGYFFVIFLYYYKIIGMLLGVGITLKTGENSVFVYKYVIVVNWILAFATIFLGFFSGITGVLSAGTEAAVIIILTCAFNHYAKVCPLSFEAYKAGVEKRKAKRKEATLDELDNSTVVVFDTAFSELNNRYSYIGKNAIRQTGRCPLSIETVAVVIDNITERKLLRLKATVASPSPATNVVLTVIPTNSESAPIGVIRSANYPIANPAGNLISEYGLVLPAETTGGIIRIEKVAFADGLCWDKASVEITFTTNEVNE